MPINLRLRSSIQSASGQCDLPILTPDAAAGVVDDDVDGAELRFRGVGGGLHLVCMSRTSAWQRQDLDALLATDLLGGLIERLLAAREQRRG